jgi:predicted AAA+ superfamily ATPase
MSDYTRQIQTAIESSLFQGKVIVLYGARQVGKTTLVRAILQKYPDNSLYLNCDEPDIRSALTDKTSTQLRQLLGGKTLVALDEAQRVRNIGLTLKLLVDTFPDIQVIATGSSSFELSNTITEPLTGRKIEFHLYPLALAELLSQETPLENRRLLETRLRYGLYPGVVASADPARVIQEIAKSYLYRDVLEYQVVRNPDLLRRLLQALALQIGGEVSYNELASLLGVDKATVARYLSLLEQAYIYDLGVRNALINNFNPLELRQDVGALWENFVISERIKRNHNRRRWANTYFWRTYDGAELDYIEEEGGRLAGLECKWAAEKWRAPAAFVAAYPGSELALVNRYNYLEFLT